MGDHALVRARERAETTADSGMSPTSGGAEGPLLASEAAAANTEDQPGGPGRFLVALHGLGSVWIFALMALVCADVFARSFLNRPIDGVAEIAGLSIAAIVFLQLGATIRAGRMTRADFLADYLIRKSPLAGHLLQAAFMALSCGVFLALAAASWAPLAGSWNRHEFMGVEGIFTVPTWPVRGVILGGSVVAAWVYLVHAVGECRAAAAGRRGKCR